MSVKSNNDPQTFITYTESGQLTAMTGATEIAGLENDGMV